MKRILVAAIAALAALVAVPLSGNAPAQAAATESFDAKAADILARSEKVEAQYTQRRWRNRGYYGRRYYRGPRYYYGPRRYYRPAYRPYYGFRPYYY